MVIVFIFLLFFDFLFYYDNINLYMLEPIFADGTAQAVKDFFARQGKFLQESLVYFKKIQRGMAEQSPLIRCF